MLWRLSHSSSLQAYLHGESPCSIVGYTEKSEKLCAAVCGKLLSRGFDVVIIAMNPTRQSNLHEHLQSAYPKRSTAFFDVHVGNAESTMRSLFDVARTRNITLAVSCVDTSLWSQPLKNSQGSSAQSNSSIDLFVELQKLTLPHLTHNSPAALLLVANTLSPSLASNEEFFESYASGLSHQLHSLGHEKVQVTFMDYYDDGAKSDRTISSLSPSPDVLSDSILWALGRNSTHVIPYWPHELLAWFVWFLLLVFPSNLVLQFLPF